MLRYEYITREWIVSSAARRVYRAAALVSLTLIPVLMSIHVPGANLQLVKFLLFVAVLGTALTLVGMEYFLFRFDDSAALKQVFWFCAMIFVPIGPALYCFLVYSRSNALKAVLSGGDGHSQSLRT